MAEESHTSRLAKFFSKGGKGEGKGSCHFSQRALLSPKAPPKAPHSLRNLIPCPEVETCSVQVGNKIMINPLLVVPEARRVSWKEVICDNSAKAAARAAEKERLSLVG